LGGILGRERERGYGVETADEVSLHLAYLFFPSPFTAAAAAELQFPKTPIIEEMKMGVGES